MRACSVLQTEVDAVPSSRLQGFVAAPVSAAGQAMYSTSLLRCDGLYGRRRKSSDGPAAALPEGEHDAATCDIDQAPRGFSAR